MAWLQIGSSHIHLEQISIVDLTYKFIWMGPTFEKVPNTKSLPPELIQWLDNEGASIFVKLKTCYVNARSLLTITTDAKGASLYFGGTTVHVIPLADLPALQTALQSF